LAAFNNKSSLHSFLRNLILILIQFILKLFLILEKELDYFLFIILIIKYY